MIEFKLNNRVRGILWPDSDEISGEWEKENVSKRVREEECEENVRREK